MKCNYLQTCVSGVFSCTLGVYKLDTHRLSVQHKSINTILVCSGVNMEERVSLLIPGIGMAKSLFVLLMSFLMLLVKSFFGINP